MILAYTHEWCMQGNPPARAGCEGCRGIEQNTVIARLMLNIDCKRVSLRDVLRRRSNCQVASVCGTGQVCEGACGNSAQVRDMLVCEPSSMLTMLQFATRPHSSVDGTFCPQILNDHSILVLHVSFSHLPLQLLPYAPTCHDPALCLCTASQQSAIVLSSHFIRRHCSRIATACN